jgi:F-type H+-transporting ATPase subunit alpha
MTRKIDVDKVNDFIDQLYEDIQIKHPEYIEEIKTKKVISDELDANLKETMKAFVEQYLKVNAAG